jgi:hypothetical protein
MMSSASTSQGSSDPALLELLAFMRSVFNGTGADQTSAHDRNIRDAVNSSAFSVVQASQIGLKISTKFAEMLPHVRDLEGLKTMLDEEGLLDYFPGIAEAIDEYIDVQANYTSAGQAARDEEKTKLAGVGASFFSLLTATSTKQLSPTGSQAKRLGAASRT